MRVLQAKNDLKHKNKLVVDLNAPMSLTLFSPSTLVMVFRREMRRKETCKQKQKQNAKKER